MKKIALVVLLVAIPSTAAACKVPVVPSPVPGPLEIALQATGNVTYTKTSTANGDDLTLWVPNAEVGAWIGTSTFLGLDFLDQAGLPLASSVSGNGVPSGTTRTPPENGWRS